jgi:hypothetical protein
MSLASPVIPATASKSADAGEIESSVAAIISNPNAKWGRRRIDKDESPSLHTGGALAFMAFTSPLPVIGLFPFGENQANCESVPNGALAWGVKKSRERRGLGRTMSSIEPLANPWDEWFYARAEVVPGLANLNRSNG